MNNTADSSIWQTSKLDDVFGIAKTKLQQAAINFDLFSQIYYMESVAIRESNSLTALAFYRGNSDRLGEANVLLEFGKLLNDPQASLNAYAESQAIYQQIGDRFSQGRTLFQYISDA